MDIVAGIVAVTEALRLTKELRNIDLELDKVELKLHLVDLYHRLLESKEALQDAKEERLALKQQISDLEGRLRQRANLFDERGRLYELDEEGNRSRDPYCNLCYVKEGKLYRMHRRNGHEYVRAHYWCDNCKNAYYD